MTKLIIGIDFGTSTTVVRYRLQDEEHNNDEQIRVLPICDRNKSSCIPSVIFKTKVRTFFGNEALMKHGGGTDGQLFTSFKMMLVDKEQSIRQEGENLTCEFMKYIYKLWLDQTKGLDYDESEIYFSHPVDWKDKRINFLENAIVKAGFTGTIHHISEPLAASYNFLHKYSSVIQNHQAFSAEMPLRVLMLDMGAGTSDIIIFKLNIDDEQHIVLDEMLSYPPIGENTMCGGREIDDLLSKWMKDYLSENVRLSQKLIDILFNAGEAKKWKDDFMSDMLKDNVEIDSMPNSISRAISCTEGGDDAVQAFHFNRQIFENLTKSHWETLYAMIGKAVFAYKSLFGVGSEDIDLLFLTGGHSLWYLVPDLFKGSLIKNTERNSIDETTLNFSKLESNDWRLLQDALPQESVATGLCVQDENIKIADKYSKNIWITFSVSEKKGEVKQVVHSGQIIPYTTSIKQGVTLPRHDLVDDLNFDIALDVYMGDALDHSLHYTYHLLHNAGGVLRRLIAALTFYIPKAWFSFYINADVSIKAEGNVDISGKIWVDDYMSSDSFYFSMQDLVEVSHEIVQTNTKNVVL